MSCELRDEFDECSSSDLNPSVTFVDPDRASTFECVICLEQLRNATAVCDDHLFCEVCVQQLCVMDIGPFVQCPSCRKKCNKQEIKRVKFIDRQIKNLLIKCPNHEITPLKSIYLQKLGNKNQKKSKSKSRVHDINREVTERSRSRSRSRSPLRIDNNDDNHNNNHNNEEKEAIIEFCDWSGNLDQLHKHILKCPFEIIRCSQCAECIERGKKDIHNTECNMFLMQCTECGYDVPRKYVQLHKDEQCIEELIKCGNCQDMVKRKNMTVHYNQCPEAVVSCFYYQYGCDMMSIKRKQLSQHLDQNMKEHLKLMSQRIQLLENKNEDLENKVNSLNNDMMNMHERLNQLESARYGF